MDGYSETSRPRAKDIADMAIKDNTKQVTRAVNRVLHEVMARTGNEFINNARRSVTQSVYSRGGRQPWELTGNLRASIGYHVLSPVGSQKQFGDVSEGREEGQRLAGDVVKEGDGFRLALVAGMPYARYVEARGYDVISNSVTTARQQFDKRIKRRLKHLR